VQILKKHLSKIITISATAGVFFMLLLTPTFAADCDPTTAGSDPIQSGANCAQASGTTDNLFGDDGLFKKVSNILIFLVGAVSVIMLIIGGFRYVVSGGDSAGVEGAKNTILYAIVGIVVAFLSYAAVNFIIGGISSS
jgi:hypothetical protein